MAREADSVSSVSASACQVEGPNSINPGQILLVYATVFDVLIHQIPSPPSFLRTQGVSWPLNFEMIARANFHD